MKIQNLVAHSAYTNTFRLCSVAPNVNAVAVTFHGLSNTSARRAVFFGFRFGNDDQEDHELTGKEICHARSTKWRRAKSFREELKHFSLFSSEKPPSCLSLAGCEFTCSKRGAPLAIERNHPRLSLGTMIASYASHYQFSCI
jgi:hypothetical protein